MALARGASFRALAIVLAALLWLAGCDAPSAVDEASTACGGREELRAAGLEPELEALVPALLGGKPADTRSSGRYCSPDQLGSLTGLGIHELRFAGATWAAGDGGRSLTVYRAAGLTLDGLADSFADGAGAARRVAGVRTSESTIHGRRAIRIDAQAGDRPQVVLLWDDPRPETIRAILASGLPESAIGEAVAAFFR